MTRERAIKLIGSMKGDLCDFYDDNDLTALEMAIASLKTDEAYQLEYENRDFVEIPKGMTNGEVIKALFPNVKVHEYTEKVVLNGLGNEFQIQSMAWKNWWNAPYQKGGE